MEDRGDKRPLLSVIVPVFNVERYLERCITSILEQTFEDMEVILVDDGSTDGSLRLCQSFHERDARVRVIAKKNGGLLRARKTGLSHARGELVGFVDSDDWIDADMYAQLVTCMEETGCDLVSSGLVREQGSQDAVTVFDHYEEGLFRDLDREIYPTMLYDDRHRDFGLYCSLCTKVFRKDLLERVYTAIDEDVFYAEDALAFYPYCLFANSVYILHKAFYHYHIRPDSMCAAADERLPYNNYRVYKGLYAAFSAARCKWALMRQLKHYMILLEKHNLLRLYHIDPEVLGKWRFSHCEHIFDKRFVLYGAGTCGQALYEKVRRSGREKNMVCWVDKEAEQKMDACAYPLQKPEILPWTEWDILIIAVKSKVMAGQIMDSLSETYKIGQSRMYWAAAEQVRD